jgi:hypothetical protein
MNQQEVKKWIEKNKLKKEFDGIILELLSLSLEYTTAGLSDIWALPIDRLVEYIKRHRAQMYFDIYNELLRHGKLDGMERCE